MARKNMHFTVISMNELDFAKLLKAATEDVLKNVHTFFIITPSFFEVLYTLYSIQIYFGLLFLREYYNKLSYLLILLDIT